MTHYNEKYGDKNQCYKIEKKENKNNKDCNKDELFNNCRTNFWHQEEVPVDSQKIIWHKRTKSKFNFDSDYVNEDIYLQIMLIILFNLIALFLLILCIIICV